ncbi:wall-associated receptor kinase-like 20 [Herrania umbratica]|uniref:Wall-associated receptor kinase-like 20 n=1 Tax=Herrania umbratica TaxID=108875 RepID=A0A6J1A9A7_9ROSI|nr:wall-associated receptor kinase-like 20 [Herrania umbratica]
MVPAVIVFLFVLVTQVSAFRFCPKCGKMEVPYPLSTGESCGDPRYRIYCDNGVLEFMSAQGFYYNILSINPWSSKLVISPPLIQENTCYSSDLGLGGLVLDENLPFNISTRNTVMLFNCSDSILLSPLNCSSSSFCRQFEDAGKGGSGCRGTLCCHFLKDASMTSHRIRVRLGGCTAYTSVVGKKPNDPIDSWNYGIELQWLPPF